MWVVSLKILRDHWKKPAHKPSERELRKWYAIAKSAAWKTPADVKRAFGVRVDFVKVESGRTIAVFDVLNNVYRLIVAIHYNRSKLFILRVLTHREYDTNRWKEEL